MAKDFDHAAWETWCKSWGGVNHDAYPNFREYQSAENDKAQSAALGKVIDQAEKAGDMKMVRNVYYHAPDGSIAKKRSLRLTIKHAVETNDALLARDAWQHAGDVRDVLAEANAAYEQITGAPYSN
jgi:hypothetical protein